MSCKHLSVCQGQAPLRLTLCSCLLPSVRFSLFPFIFHVCLSLSLPTPSPPVSLLFSLLSIQSSLRLSVLPFVALTVCPSAFLRLKSSLRLCLPFVSPRVFLLLQTSLLPFVFFSVSLLVSPPVCFCLQPPLVCLCLQRLSVCLLVSTCLRLFVTSVSPLVCLCPELSLRLFVFPFGYSPVPPPVCLCLQSSLRLSVYHSVSPAVSARLSFRASRHLLVRPLSARHP